MFPFPSKDPMSKAPAKPAMPKAKPAMPKAKPAMAKKKPAMPKKGGRGC
jgi:hypothetical protein